MNAFESENHPIFDRGLFGSQLEGDTIVRFAYVDEAGISNPKQEPWLVVCGVLLDADKQLVAVERKLESLIKRHIPVEQQKGFVLHTAEIFNGASYGKVFDRHNPLWTPEKRFEIADDIARIVKQSCSPVSFGLVERSKITKEYVDPSGKEIKHNLACHIIGFVTCSMRIERWMRNNAPDEVTMLIVEDNQEARQRMLDMHNHYQDKSRIFDDDDPLKLFFPFKKIKESPLFQKKQQSAPLQLADFCAYIMKRLLMKDERFRRFYEPWQSLVIEEPIPLRS